MTVGTAVIIGAYAASPFIQTVGESDADERTAIQKASQERAAQNGGVDPQLEPAPQPATGGAGRKGRGGRQKRLRELAKDDKLSSALKGFLQNEINSERRNLRVPPGTELTHRRGMEARKGFDYSHSDLQDKSLHDTQHRVERDRNCMGCGGTYEQRHPPQPDNH